MKRGIDSDFLGHYRKRDCPVPAEGTGQVLFCGCYILVIQVELHRRRRPALHPVLITVMLLPSPGI